MPPRSVNYSHDQMMNMQQDAIRRVREMQQRAQEKIAQTNASQKPPPVSAAVAPVSSFRNPEPPPVRKDTAPPRRRRPAPEPVPMVPRKESSSFSLPAVISGELPFGDLLKGLGSDRILILLLMFLLWQEEEINSVLIMALGYILLFD